jgi:hypothetical protein
MSGGSVLMSVRPAAERGSLSVDEVWKQDVDGPLGNYSHVFPLAVGRELHLVCVDGDGAASAFRVRDDHAWIVPVESELRLGGPWDIVQPFVLGNVPHVLAYASEMGHFAFYPIGSDLRSEAPFRFTRRRGPDATAGFDVTQPMNIRGAVHYLCYSSATGRVLIYSLAVTATSPPDTAPLASASVWVHQWAPQWERFAFFELGAGTFFLKTNVGRLNVNIDKVIDNPSEGTVEVGTYLDLDNALELDIVRSFYVEDAPYFVTYMKDGTTTLNRFHADCQGWTTEATFTAPRDVAHVVPLQLRDTCHLLFH